jgi:3-isopropylmalate/(R)-2-methylmalate dehydratase small subunit
MSTIINQVAGRAFLHNVPNLDTDRIIPAQFLKCVTFEGLGEHVFHDDRQQAGGKHPFDLKTNQGRNILVTGANFGSGSSREHAVPALMQWGIEAIIAPSFSDIFTGNAGGNGLVCVVVEPEDHEYICTSIEQGMSDVRIDLLSSTIHVGESDLTFSFSMPKSMQVDFLAGTWDQIANALDAGNLIEQRAATLPAFQSSFAALTEGPG